jgi:dCTP deaminase
LILTAKAIEMHRSAGEIVIEPFDRSHLGTVSYEFHAGSEIAPVEGPLDSRTKQNLVYQTLPADGFLLEPDRLYLLSTLELMGSSTFAQRIFGTRATGSTGLFIDVSADLGHVGCVTHWTLELVSVRRLLLFPGQTIGQITFWSLSGASVPYRGHFHGMVRPLPSKAWMDL